MTSKILLSALLFLSVGCTPQQGVDREAELPRSAGTMGSEPTRLSPSSGSHPRETSPPAATWGTASGPTWRR